MPRSDWLPNVNTGPATLSKILADYFLRSSNGTPRKWLDTSRLGALGWTARIPLEGRIARMVRHFAATKAARGRLDKP